MSRRTVVLLVALVLAVAASFSVWRYLDAVERDVRADVAEVVVYTATELISTGTDGATALPLIQTSTALVENVVFDGSTILCRGPAENADIDPNVCVGNPSDLDALLTGTVAAGPISAGQLITQDMFVAPAQLDVDALSGRIPGGKVAVAINPGEVGSVGGLIVPGDRVNIMATTELDLSSLIAALSSPDTRDLLIDSGLLGTALTSSQPTQPELDDEGNPIDTGQQVGDDVLSRYLATLPSNVRLTQTILQNIPVLAVGAQTVDSSALDVEIFGETSIVIEVTAEEAELVELARQTSVLALALLSEETEYGAFDSTGTALDDVYRVLERILSQVETLNVD